MVVGVWSQKTKTSKNTPRQACLIAFGYGMTPSPVRPPTQHARCLARNPSIQILFRQAPLRHDMLQYVSFREDAEGVALQAAEGGEEMWMLGDREQWLDHLLALLLPMVEYVEVKQSLHHKDNPLPRKFMC